MKEGKIQSLEEIYLFSMPIKESQIIDKFLGEGVLKDELMARGFSEKFGCFHGEALTVRC